MKDRGYKEVWQTLKEEKIRYFILLNDAYKVHQLERQSISLNVTRQTLLQMDQLDGTHEFSNLLDDMNRERE
ncbi:hypothetical protein [Mammaliicoccus fleurettii]|uniref:hypothetical protein n=1 Tax=Mammaliicoccus fleurettii TaxID=150056 RepID=UPI0009928BE3|nr:hypothetical protein [Mammaliicoccus fleurettii]OOV78885.1 hypothetical protein B2G86_00740 [Mammaliicoccus fleurettii]